MSKIMTLLGVKLIKIETSIENFKALYPTLERRQIQFSGADTLQILFLDFLAVTICALPCW